MHTVESPGLLQALLFWTQLCAHNHWDGWLTSLGVGVTLATLHGLSGFSWHGVDMTGATSGQNNSAVPSASSWAVGGIAWCSHLTVEELAPISLNI